MSITFPKPKLWGPKIPGVLVAGLLAAQFALFGGHSGPEPKCVLKVDQPHYSTHLAEFMNADAIKLNMVTTCNVPQAFTKLDSKILKISNNREVTAYKFLPVVVSPNSRNPLRAEIKNLYAPCNYGVEVAYKGEASGYVKLQSGEKITVSGSSEKYVLAPCSIRTQ
jgi:hypothetical protein